MAIPTKSKYNELNLNARKEIVAYLKRNGWYGVAWSTHFCGNVFLIYKLNKERTPDRKSEVYKAIFESLYDLDGSNTPNPDIQLDRFDRMESWIQIRDEIKSKYKSTTQLIKEEDHHFEKGDVTCWILKAYNDGARKGTPLGSASTLEEAMRRIRKDYSNKNIEIRPRQRKGFCKKKSTEIVVTQIWF